MKRFALAFAALAGCNQTGAGAYGEPWDQLAGFAGSPSMQPGADCMQCHSTVGGANGLAPDSGLPVDVATDRQWTIAGTVFGDRNACQCFNAASNTGCPGGVQGVQVLVTDSNGQELTLTSDSAGNFYTDQPIGTLTSLMIQTDKRRMVMNLSALGGGQDLTLSHILAFDAGNAISCNGCHCVGNVYHAPGSLFIPTD